MSLRGDSYGSIAEVLAFTRHFLDGQSTFNGTTRPTLTEVEKFINRASGVLNVALKGGGFSTPLNSTNANSTTKLLADDWVVNQAVALVEFTARGTGFDDSEGSRAWTFKNMNKAAVDFVDMNRLALERAGANVAHPRGEGISYTGLLGQSDRVDPDDTTLEQPKFARGLFDSP